MLSKKIIALGMLVVTSNTWAAMCPVTVENDLLLTPTGEVKVDKAQDKLRIDQNGRVFVNGDELDLTQEQKLAIEKYQQQVVSYMPSVVDFADKGIAAANDFVNEIEISFDAEGSFDSVKNKIDEYGVTAKQKFYKGKDLVLEHDFFKEVDTTWKSDFEVMIQSLDKELFASVFNSLSDKMQNGELNFSELQQQFSEVQTSIKAKMSEHSKEIKEDAQELCDSAKEIAEEEKTLHQLIPELQPYPVFTI
ncbi:DUF2884 family protein [Aliivibrio finisterrensis]|uniref:DUF2884 family protein n=1 Tax=Aliivibrio finisterrensis TaxID=511998 RepID=A0A4Q5KLZ5_9GAMM|nr:MULTISPECIES: YggN family protein [Aliivibrio]MDD9176122.1 YggN family protein [Aliivibrio sp. S3TY1]MDD9193270.1 YggN family protein [Aliivibrio sp. S2TY2]RYU45836.1 DUF2884 family protein [Aliivibrio finisterrensis]